MDLQDAICAYKFNIGSSQALLNVIACFPGHISGVNMLFTPTENKKCQVTVPDNH